MVQKLLVGKEDSVLFCGVVHVILVFIGACKNIFYCELKFSIIIGFIMTIVTISTEVNITAVTTMTAVLVEKATTKVETRLTGPTKQTGSRTGL